MSMSSYGDGVVRLVACAVLTRAKHTRCKGAPLGPQPFCNRATCDQPRAPHHGQTSKMFAAPHAGDKPRKQDLVLAPDADGRQRNVRTLDEKLVSRATVRRDRREAGERRGDRMGESGWEGIARRGGGPSGDGL